MRMRTPRMLPMVFIMWMTLMMVMMPVVVTKERPRRFKVTSRSQYLSRFDASCRIQQQSHCSLPQEFRTYWSTIWTVDCIYRRLTALVQAEDRVYVTLTPFQRCKAPAWLRNRLCGGWFFFERTHDRVWRRTNLDDNPQTSCTEGGA